MGESSRIFEFLAEQMADCDTQWSLGTFGAIAEFSRDPDEPVTLGRAERQVSAVTARGAIAIALQEEMRPVASESLTKSSWNQRVALCLPRERCAMHRRCVLTELGSDADALREQDRKAVLFDLGLDALQADFCVRIADADIAAALRAHVGRSVFQAGNPAMAIILRANPHRVFMSRLGRIEVYQPIPPMHGVSPEGPHTHVLPKLLQHRRTHPATEAIPAGWAPCAHVYPAHATKDGMGGTRTFDPARHDAFHRLLIEFGDPDLIRLKQRVIAAVAGAQAPPLSIAANRFARASIRVALRQLQAHPEPPPALAGWLAAYERAADADPDQDAFAEAHGDH